MPSSYFSSDLNFDWKMKCFCNNLGIFMGHSAVKDVFKM